MNDPQPERVVVRRTRQPVRVTRFGAPVAEVVRERDERGQRRAIVGRVLACLLVRPLRFAELPAPPLGRAEARVDRGALFGSASDEESVASRRTP